MLKNKIKSSGLVVSLVFGAAGIAACRQDMHDNPRYKAYRDGAARQLPEGTVARGSLALNPPAPKVGASPATAPRPQASPAAAQVVPTSANPAGQPAQPGAAAAPAIPVGEDGFPFKITREILDRGENRFNISCAPCHGKLGDGYGMITMRGLRHPPSYTDERLRKAPSSYLYDVITNGFGAMPSYADQLTPEDRWKVIAFIRVLQLSQRADVNQLAETDKKKIEEAERKAGEKTGAHSGAQTASGGQRN